MKLRLALVALTVALLVAGALIAATGDEGGEAPENVPAALEGLPEETLACIEEARENGVPGEAELESELESSEGEAEEADSEAAESGEAEDEEASGESEAEREAICGIRRPEPYEELSTATQTLGNRVGTDAPGDALASSEMRDRAKVLPGRWKPVGKGPLRADDPRFPQTYGNGFGELNGRIADYDYDPAHDRLFAAVASGGVWMSANTGKSWTSIGDDLPTQTVGSIEYSPAAGGTLIAVTGDNAFGGNTYGGVGVYRSTNLGRTWTRSRGVPSGLQGFKAAIDPGNPQIVYAATGGGLFRSTNDGKSFTNVNLPTGDCAGTTFKDRNCFFANIVTDVVVQAKDRFGNKNGGVLAVVGWRDGRRHNFNGVPEATGNGLYVSQTGRPGSFNGLNEGAIGFAPQENIGRVELGEAIGPKQNHDYVYAVVQDAELFNKGTVEGLDVGGGDAFGLDPTATPTYLEGIYVSDDFGRSWTQMADDNQMLSPTSGSTLAQLSPLGFGPGIQSWYNEWIQPDPTRQLNGVPTRIVFGLEEIYTNRLPTPQDGRSDFKVIGPYNATGGPCLLVIATPACSDASNANPNRFTTHPDQHSGMWIPDEDGGGVTLIAGNDGGNYTQHTSATGDLSQAGFGKGDNDGFHTLLPYGVAGSSDGTVYAGLQDNGEIKILPKSGRQIAIFGGDGVFTLTEPKNSDVVYDELPEAGINVSTDGGVTYRDIDPFVDNASFYAPFVMDPKDPDHLLTGGKQIVETTHGENTQEWKTVFRLGRSKRTKIENQVSALAVRGKYAYAGYCGGCDVVRDKQKFFSGLATNVNPRQGRKPGKKSPWHKVEAKGVPHRFISSVTIAPKKPKVVYLTLGASDIRPYSPPKALGKDGLSTRPGHVYMSTDGGKHFRDISANLNRTPALWSMTMGRKLLVATTVGVFATNRRHPGKFRLLGKSLPKAPVFQITKFPGHPRQVLAASLGRGVYKFTMPKKH